MKPEHVCLDCGIVLHKRHPSGPWHLRCRPCKTIREGPMREVTRREYKRARSAAWYGANRDKANERERIKRQSNPEAYSARRSAALRRSPEASRARATAWRIANPERRKDSHARRKARKLSNGVEAYQRLAIYDRDRWTCQLCDGQIDSTLQYPDPMCASIDHVTPLSLGGADAPGNVQASHLICNMRKGARLTA